MIHWSFVDNNEVISMSFLSGYFNVIGWAVSKDFTFSKNRSTEYGDNKNENENTECGSYEKWLQEKNWWCKYLKSHVRKKLLHDWHECSQLW